MHKLNVKDVWRLSILFAMPKKSVDTLQEQLLFAGTLDLNSGSGFAVLTFYYFSIQ